MMNFQNLRYVVQVSAIGSMNKAAEILHISQSSLSRAIQEVERETGILIFERTNKGVVTTPEGRTFIGKVQPLLDEFDVLQNRYFREKGEKDDEIALRIGVERHYPPIYAFLQYYNNYCKSTDNFVNLVLCESNRDDIVKQVNAGVLRIGVVHYTSENKNAFLSELSSKSIEYRVLSEGPVCAQVSDKHPLAGKAEVSLKMLSDYPRIAFLDEDFTGINYCSDLWQYDRSLLKKRIVLQERGTHRLVLANTDGYSIGAYYDINKELNPDISSTSTIRCIPITGINISFVSIVIFKQGMNLTEEEGRYLTLLFDHYGKKFDAAAQKR